MTTFSVRPVTEDQTDSPYVDVMYTLEEEEWENVTDYQEGGFGSEGTLSESSNCSDLASLDATASLGDPEVLAVRAFRQSPITPKATLLVIRDISPFRFFEGVHHIHVWRISLILSRRSNC